jgi:hypothetical protein
LLQTKEKTDSTGRSPDGRIPFFTFFRALIALNRRLLCRSPLFRPAEGRKLKKPRGATIAALQTVIVSERRSREPNDLKLGSEQAEG